MEEMMYGVSGKNAAGAIAHKRETLPEAIALARDLIAKGYTEVKVIDGTGKEIPVK
jgi:hypothetical protein